ncbi:ABC transporter ATP-binding protein [Neomicrococcus lactis]|uniref:ATP-binding cassette subfamily B protein n=1 Tax=Neomicrococcus lactis TaxID=732241 RepID=A0A7W9DC95_9MICC|nr:ATP-binding cassette subfamily B protein [Neomicrococcus lactis]
MKTESRTAETTTLFGTLKRLGPFVKPYSWRLFGGFLAALAAGIVALAIPQVMGELVNNVLHPGTPTSALLWVTAIVAVLGALEAFFIYLRRVFVITPASLLEAEMRIGLFKHLQQLPVSFHDKWASGQLLSRSMADLSHTRRWLAFGAIMFVVSTVTIIVGLGVMFSSSWILGVLYLLGAIPVVIRSFYFRNRFRVVSRLSQDQAGDLATNVEESVQGIRVLKAFGRGQEALDGFETRAQTLRETEISKAKTLGAFLAVIVSVPEIVLALGLILGTWLVVHQQLTVGGLVAFFATAAVLARPVESVGMLLGMTFATKTALDRYFDVRDSVNTITSPAQPKPFPDVDGGTPAAASSSKSASLELQNVSFAFADAPDAPILKDVNLAVRPGETMALVGVTGSGKSALCELVPRLYDVTGGRILLNGVDLRELDLETVRSRVSIAFEDSILFSSTVRDNVLLGAPERTEAALKEALAVAEADFVNELPEGVNTMIGEQGLSLSGGQRQRLSLARAIAAKPSVLVLDDPLSALDVRTEEKVTENLRVALQRTTTLIVAHRPSTVVLADRVALLKDGTIVDVGTHAEMLARNADYRDVISSFEQAPTVEEVL